MVTVERHPIRLVLSDDLERSRLTVFFRLLLAIPHAIWLSLWTFAALVVGVAAWALTMARGTLPQPLHDFYVQYARYTAHVYAYVHLAANPFPGFTGRPGYPVDVEVDPPARQRRATVAFRAVLALPALVVASALAGFGVSGGGSTGTSVDASVIVTAAFLGWFACLALARMPRGLRNVGAYAIRYVVQTVGYLLFLTDRYPDSRPALDLPATAPEHPVALAVADDLRRSRLTVFFRALLVVPHLVWLVLWSLAALVAAVVNWATALATGRPAAVLHRFLSAYLRYSTHVGAFLFLVANPFPGFAGAAGSYPVDLVVGPPAAQRRWATGLRALLAVPGLLLAGALGSALYAAAFLGWFASLAVGRMPRGLRDLGAYALRYSAQTTAYLVVVTGRYPYGGPEAPAPAGAALPAG